MNQTLSEIYSLEKHLLELKTNVKYKITMYSKTSEEVIEASKELDTHLYHPSADLKECYWFIYKSKLNPKISIRVKGPLL